LYKLSKKDFDELKMKNKVNKYNLWLHSLKFLNLKII
jgi:hypothetical protein